MIGPLITSSEARGLEDDWSTNYLKRSERLRRRERSTNFLERSERLEMTGPPIASSEAKGSIEENGPAIGRPVSSS